METFKQKVNIDETIKFVDLLPRKVVHKIKRVAHQDKYKAALQMYRAFLKDKDMKSRGLSKKKMQDIAADHFKLSRGEFAKILNRKTRYEEAPPGMADTVKKFKADGMADDMAFALAWKIYNKKKNEAEYVTEATMNPDDFFKRDNQVLFVTKAKAGEIVSAKDGKMFPKVSAADMKPLSSLDGEPDKGTDEDIAFRAMIKKHFNAFTHIEKAANGMSPPSSGSPSGEDWESLIAVGVNKINKEKGWNKSSEFIRAEKFWSDYEKPAMKLGQDFINTFGIKHLEQTGASSAPLSKVWKGKNKTPKTDLLSAKGHKISLKKHGGSQLMSAGKEEAISTFEAAMNMYSLSKEGKTQVTFMMDEIQENMNKMSTAGTIGALEKLRDSGKNLSKADKDAIEEMEGLQDAANLLNPKLDKTFQDDDFKKYFCWEAATGETKFGKGTQATSNLLVVFKESGKISDSLVLDTPANAGATIAKANNFYVSFKTGGSKSKPYLSLRTKKASKKDFIPESFADIVYDEVGKSGLLLEDMEQLDEFQIFNRLAKKIKGVSNQIKNQVKKIFDAIMKRMSQAFNYIKGLGEKLLEGLMAFFGILVNNVTIRGGGKFPL